MRALLLTLLGLPLGGSGLRHRALLEPWQPLEVPLTRTPEGWYVAEVDLAGMPRRLVVDTGSPWLWAFGQPGQSGADGQPEQGQEQEQGQPFRVQYTGVALEGVASQQALSLAGQAAAAQQCTVGRATAGDDFWLRQKGVDGVAGLACGTRDTAGGGSSSGGLNVSLGCFAAAAGSRQFALELTEDGGTLSFGAIPERLLPGLKDMPPSLFCGNWRAPMRVFAGEGRAAKAVGQPAEAMIDSGEPGVRGPLEAVMKLASALGAETVIDPENGSGVHFQVPCDKADSLPSLTLALGDAGEAKVTLPGAALVGKKNAKGACSVLLRGSDARQWVLGMPFFRSIRGVLFDPDRRGVSIAP